MQKHTSKRPPATATAAADRIPGSGKLAPVLIALGPTMVVAMVYFILPIIAPAMMVELGHQPEDYGWLAGAIGFGSVWFYTANSAITPVLGPLNTLRLGLLITIAGILLMIFGNWPLALLGGCLLGIGYGTTTPTSSQILADFTPRQNWGMLFSLRQAGVPAGGMIAGILSVVTLTEFGWQATLAICIAIVAAIGLILLSIPGRYNSSRPLARFSFTRLVSPLNFIRPIADIKTIPGLPVVVLAGCGFAVVHGAVTSFFVIYLVKGLGVEQDNATILFIVLQATAILGRVFFGALADRLGSPLIVLRFLAPLSAGSAIMLSAIDPAWPHHFLIGAAFIIGLTVGTWNGLYLAEIARIAPPEAIGSATASAAFFGFATYMITPPIVAALVRVIGWRPTFVAVAFAAIFAGVVLAMRQWRTSTPS